MRRITSTLAVSLVLASIQLTAGCASNKAATEQVAERTAGTFLQDLKTLPGLLDGASSSLVSLTDIRNADKASGLANLTKSIGSLEGFNSKIGSEFEMLSKYGEKYFADSRKSIAAAMGSGDRAAAEKAMADTNAERSRFNLYRDQLRVTQTEYNKLILDMRDLSKDLTANPTADGIAKLSDRINAALNSTTNVKARATGLVQTLQSALK
jgi:hypothetical protein